MEQIIRWFQEDTCAMLRRLPDWEGAAAAAVKRSNLLMKREGKSEGGLQAFKVLLPGEAGDLAPLKKWIQQREEKEARESKEAKKKPLQSPMKKVDRIVSGFGNGVNIKSELMKRRMHHENSVCRRLQ